MNKQNPPKWKWEVIPDYEGKYEISSAGDVRSNAKSKIGTSRIIKPRLKNSGYLFVTLYKAGQRKNFYIHQLVARAFIGERPAKADVNHIDGNKLNNAADNLEYVTRSENMEHARRMGLHNNRGATHYNTRFTEDQIIAIRRAYNLTGTGAEDIAPTFNVAPKTIQDILQYKTWRSVE